MPQFHTGNMWTAYPTTDLFLITTNCILRQDGALVVGRGIAQQARDRFPGLAASLCQRSLDTCGGTSPLLRASPGKCGLLVSSHWPEAKLGAFQVKHHYRLPTSLELIRHSTAVLCAWCAAHPDAQAILNFPGIGNGRLRRETVLPIIAQLLKQVII